MFEVRGGPAPPPEPPGTLLLWFFDTSAGEEERAKLALRLRQTEGALDSLTHLIEAAPFPMWYRGPDLKLGLVNNAFVEAVEGRDAAEVIARGAELIDDSESAMRGRAQRGRKRHASRRGCSRRSFAASGACCASSTSRCRPERSPALRSTSRISRTRAPSSTGYMESQRELADRMTAGTAQFDADRNVSFFNRPFAVMTQLDPDWLGEQPEFDRVIERMRDNHRLPETRDFPAWKDERRGWFSSPEEVVEEEWMLPNGDHLRVVAQPLPDGGLRLFLEDRTEQLQLASARDTLLRVRAATFDNLFEAISVFASDGRLYLWNRRFIDDWELDEEWLSEHPRVDELVPAMAKKLVNPTAAAQIREMVRQTTNDRTTATGRMAMTDGRHFQFAAVPLPDGNALFTMVDVTDSTRIEAALARARHRARGSRPGEDRFRRQHELRIAHSADLDRRLRRAARRRLCGQDRDQGDRLCGRDSRIRRAPVEADRRRPRSDDRRHARRAARTRTGRCRRPVPCGGRKRARRAARKRRRSSRPKYRARPDSCSAMPGGCAN